MDPPGTRIAVVVKVGSNSVHIHHSIDLGNYSKSTVSDYFTGKRWLQQFSEFAGANRDAFASIPLTAVTAGDVQNWLDGLGLSPQSAVSLWRILVTLFAHAEARSFIPHAEIRALRCETPRVRRPDVEGYTPEDLIRFLRAAPEAYCPCLAIGALAGPRSAEIERLTWDAIDSKRGYLKVTAGRATAGSRRRVPICDAL